MSNRVDPSFIVKLQKKEFVLYQGLLDLAHQLGLKSLTGTILQFPTSENNMLCICTTTAEMLGEDGVLRTFTDVGDASPENVGSTIKPHIVRMAMTRSNARTLRNATNVGITAYEEMDVDVAPEPLRRPPDQRLTTALETLAKIGITVANPPSADDADLDEKLEQYFVHYKAMKLKLEKGKVLTPSELLI